MSAAVRTALFASCHTVSTAPALRSAAAAVVSKNAAMSTTGNIMNMMRGAVAGYTQGITARGTWRREKKSRHGERERIWGKQETLLLLLLLLPPPPLFRSLSLCVCLYVCECLRYGINQLTMKVPHVPVVFSPTALCLCFTTCHALFFPSLSLSLVCVCVCVPELWTTDNNVTLRAVIICFFCVQAFRRRLHRRRVRFHRDHSPRRRRSRARRRPSCMTTATTTASLQATRREGRSRTLC